jgi:serine protease Do
MWRAALSRWVLAAVALCLAGAPARVGAQTVTNTRFPQIDDSARFEELRRTIGGMDAALEVYRAAMPAGWIGILSQGSSRQYYGGDGLHVMYFEYPTVLSVDPRSPAERAGVAPGDVLVAYDGIDLIRREFNLSKLLAPGTRLKLTVRRDGETQTYPIDVATAPEGVFRRRVALGQPVPRALFEQRLTPAPAPMPMPAFAGPSMVLSPRGAFGASLSPVGAGLAKALKLEQGLLVNEAPEESPAYAAGLRAGDVIVGAGAQPVSSLDDLQNLVVAHLGNRAIALQVVRDHKAKRITVTW